MPSIEAVAPRVATSSADTASEADAFVARWEGVTASELASSQTFLIELCELLKVPRPRPTPEQDYMFERPLTFRHGDGSTSAGRVDLYRRGCFVLESKKLDAGVQAHLGRTTRGFDDAMMRARGQAEGYARALPASDGRPPFLVVVDVGHVFELYAEFTRSGATYTPFPDPRSHRIRLQELRDPAVRERLRRIWLDPLSLDPARISARVTQAVSGELATLAASLERDGHSPEHVAAFLCRCLFSMFAEDVGLLPDARDGGGSFLQMLRTFRDEPETLRAMLQVFWQAMDTGGFNAAITRKVLRFNGKLFKGAGTEHYVLPLSPQQIDGLIRAASSNWREVEPAIFGTLLERALDKHERHSLGAHYTPRSYVERLVLPTVVEPLRADWADAQAAALLLARDAALLDKKDATKAEVRKRDELMAAAVDEVRAFLDKLCSVRVLDPACGSGNFLYVTLEHLKRLEGEVLDQLHALGASQAQLGYEGHTVALQQLRGIELNPRAAALAELVLWVGWLQWQIRTGGLQSVAEPVVHDYGNIECRDALLLSDGQEPACGEDGQPLTRWDGISFRKHPVTGEDVPDELAQVPQWRYLNPRRAQWPQADFIVGNPPFIGASSMRAALGDGYAEVLRSTWPEVPESADFVMYWWHHGAATVRAGGARQFGFITTNSLRQTFNRRVISAHLDAPNPLTLAFAIPDHPWVDSANGAAVRIAMTVGTATPVEGRLLKVTQETPADGGEVDVQLEERRGLIHADLRIGANVAGAGPLKANAGLSSPGVKLHGKGFIVTPEQAASLGLGTVAGLQQHIREYRNGKDLTSRPRGVMVIDLFGMDAEAVRRRFPAVFQWVQQRVKPERDQNNRATYRNNWWIFGEPRKDLRPSLEGLNRYIATVETAKHRFFQFLDISVLPDNMLIAIASQTPWHLGVLSSQVHVDWALAAGGRQGVGNDPRYNKTRCFETFPFPDEDTGLTAELARRIGNLAEQIDAHRKERQAAHAGVTLTGLYNVLDKLRRQEPLSEKESELHEQGLVTVLQSLHDDLDAAVLQAYGWGDLGAVPWSEDVLRQAWCEAVLERLVELNARRAAEEGQGRIRWLRQAFQDEALGGTGNAVPSAADASAAEQAEIDLDDAAAAGAAPAARVAWPSSLPEQMRAVADALAAAPAGLDLNGLGNAFTGRGPWKKRLPQILDTLVALGRARQAEGTRWRAM